MASKAGGKNAEAVEVEVREDLSTLDRVAFNRLGGGNPFVSHEFFSALHDTGCASRKSGWQPVFLVLHKDQCLRGVMPLYLKNHSRGEYVFGLCLGGCV